MKKNDKNSGRNRAAQDGSSVLAAYDRALFCAAANYDVELRSDRRRSTRDLERFFFQLVRIFQPELFIEAGAKDATASRRVRALCADIRIVAFEANPYTYERFSSKVPYAEEGVEYLHLALSNEVGTVSFNVQRDEKGAPRANGRGSLLDQQDYAEGLEKVTVPCSTLDVFFEEQDYTRSCMWVDVEGATEIVLGGGPETLQKAAAIFIEVEDRAVWEGQWLRADVAAHLFDAGFVPIARDFQARYLYNMVFVRESLLDTDRVRWALTRWHSDGSIAQLAQALRRGVDGEAEKLVGWLKSSAKRLSDKTKLFGDRHN